MKIITSLLILTRTLMSVHHYFPLKVLEGIRAIEHRKISSIMPQFMATIFLSFPLSNFHLLPSISSHASSLLWSYDSFRFCFFLILSRAEGDHFTFNKAPLKYRGKSCVLLFYWINITAVCSIQHNENKLHSNHSQNIPCAVKEFFTRPKVVWEENRHDKRRKNWAWRTLVAWDSCKQATLQFVWVSFGSLAMDRRVNLQMTCGGIQSWLCHKCTCSIGKYFAGLPALSFLEETATLLKRKQLKPAVFESFSWFNLA